MYADDLTFVINKEFVSWGLVKVLYKVLVNVGFNPNKDKTEIFNFNKYASFLGIKHHNSKYLPRKTHLLKKKIKLMRTLLGKGLTHSFRLSKDLLPIKLEKIKEGLEIWLKTINQIPSSSKTYYITDATRMQHKFATYSRNLKNPKTNWNYFYGDNIQLNLI